MYYFTTYHSPIGEIYIVSDETHLVGAWLEGQKYFQGNLKEQPQMKENLPVLEKAKQWFADYFAGKRPDSASLPLKPQGSEFRQTVWKILCEIPYGETTTYGSIAGKVVERMGREKMSAQAIGGAVGHNPLSIIIPCHRVVGTDGSLTGYAGGIDLKMKLLHHEGVPMENKRKEGFPKVKR